MNLDLSYAGGTFTMNFELGTATPRTWNVWFVYGKKAATRQFALAIPVLPVETRRVSIPLTPRGEVGILSTLQKAGEGVACSPSRRCRRRRSACRLFAMCRFSRC